MILYPKTRSQQKKCKLEWTLLLIINRYIFNLLTFITYSSLALSEFKLKSTDLLKRLL